MVSIGFTMLQPKPLRPWRRTLRLLKSRVAKFTQMTIFRTRNTHSSGGGAQTKGHPAGNRSSGNYFWNAGIARGSTKAPVFGISIAPFSD